MIGVDLAAPAALRTTSGVPVEGTKHTKFVGHARAREVKTKLFPSVFGRPFVRMWHRTDKTGGKWQNTHSQPHILWYKTPSRTPRESFHGGRKKKATAKGEKMSRYILDKGERREKTKTEMCR